jgi:hypothetical protein
MIRGETSDCTNWDNCNVEFEAGLLPAGSGS